jgi:hypothetical protein
MGAITVSVPSATRPLLLTVNSMRTRLALSVPA